MLIRNPGNISFAQDMLTNSSIGTEGLAIEQAVGKAEVQNPEDRSQNDVSLEKDFVIPQMGDVQLRLAA